MSQMQLREQLEDDQAHFELWCEFMLLNSKKTRVRYEQLITEGFTQDQAMEIINAHGISF